MDTIWAPWRIQYILGPKDKGCFLCDAFKDDKDRERLVVRRYVHNALVLNRYPYNPGHLMIAPYRHVDSLAAMTPGERAEMMELSSSCVETLKRVMNPQGFNIGINLGDVAGAGLKDHIHLHIVPRWNGDTNFMPVLGQTRVIPQALDDVWLQLHEAFRNA